MDQPSTSKTNPDNSPNTGELSKEDMEKIEEIMKCIRISDPKEEPLEGIEKINFIVAYCFVQEDRNFLDKFKACKTYADRVQFTYEKMFNFNLLPPLIEDKKCNIKSEEMRLNGNDEFASSFNNSILITYTKSISLAENNSSALGLAYANRSAVLFKMELYRECLEDIERALENNYPENLKYKILERQIKAKQLMKPFESAYEAPPKIRAGNRNYNIQSGSNFIKIAQNKKWGHHLVATRDINIGELLIVEKPYIHYTDTKLYRTYCHECLRLCYNLIPCPNCTKALFCGIVCLSEATKQYHKYECGLLLTIEDLKLSASCLLPCKMIYILKNNLSTLSNLKLDPKEKYRSDRYKEIHNLAQHIDENKLGSILGKTVICSIIFHLMKTHTEFLNDLEIPNKENVLKGYLLQSLDIFTINGFHISEMSKNESNTYEVTNIGSAIYSLLSLLNHSCCPNVVTIHHGTTVAIRAFKTIRRNEQLFMTYGAIYESTKRIHRIERLRNEYFFNCTCMACANDWPILAGLTERAPIRLIEPLIDGDTYASFLECDVQIAKQLLPRLSGVMKRIERYEPCQRVSLIRKDLRKCFLISGNKRRIN